MATFELLLKIARCFLYLSTVFSQLFSKDSQMYEIEKKDARQNMASFTLTFSS